MLRKSLSIVLILVGIAVLVTACSEIQELTGGTTNVAIFRSPNVFFPASRLWVAVTVPYCVTLVAEPAAVVVWTTELDKHDLRFRIEV